MDKKAFLTGVNLSLEALHNPVTDSRLEDPLSKITIVFDGSITLWRTGSHLDILVVYHEPLDCMEIIVYEPSLDKEAPRVYVSASKLFSHINKEDLQKKLNTRKELSIRQKIDIDLTLEQRRCELEFASNYIVSRVVVDALAKEHGHFEVFLQSKFNDTIIKRTPGAPGVFRSPRHRLIGAAHDGLCLDVVIARPESLTPILTKHFAQLGVNAFQDWKDDFQANVKDIEDTQRFAVESLTTAKFAIQNAFSPRSTIANRVKDPFKRSGAASKARLNWLKAIDRVIHRNLCAKIRLMLDCRGKTQDTTPRISSSPGLGTPPTMSYDSLSLSSADSPHLTKNALINETRGLESNYQQKNQQKQLVLPAARSSVSASSERSAKISASSGRKESLSSVHLKPLDHSATVAKTLERSGYDSEGPSSADKISIVRQRSCSESDTLQPPALEVQSWPRKSSLSEKIPRVSMAVKSSEGIAADSGASGSDEDSDLSSKPPNPSSLLKAKSVSHFEHDKPAPPLNARLKQQSCHLPTLDSARPKTASVQSSKGAHSSHAPTHHHHHHHHHGEGLKYNTNFDKSRQYLAEMNEKFKAISGQSGSRSLFH